MEAVGPVQLPGRHDENPARLPSMTMVSDEEGGFIRTWRHTLTAVPIDDRRCLYEDRIEIDAWILTPAVAAFAEVFYRYRQRRWERLAGLLRTTAEAA